MSRRRSAQNHDGRGARRSPALVAVALGVATAVCVPFSPVSASAPPPPAPRPPGAPTAPPVTTPGAPTTTLTTGTTLTTVATRTTAPATTTTVGECTPVAPTGSFRAVTATQIVLDYSSPSAYQCGVLRPTTLAVYADAGHTVPVASYRLLEGTQTGVHVFTGLTPSTDYYVRLSLDDAAVAPTDLPVARTTVAPTTTGTRTSSSTTTTTSAPTITTTPVEWPPCDYGGTMQAAGESATTTSIIYRYRVSGGGYFSCTYERGYLISADITLYADEALTRPVAAWAVPAGATSGGRLVAGLTPGTTYYGRTRVYGPLGYSSVVAPFSTLPLTGTSTSTSTSTSSTTPTTPTTATTPTGAKTCSATWQTVSSWPGGFLAQVTVTNRSEVASSSWQVAWTWSGAARVTHSYHATLGGTATAATLTALDWNRVVRPGASVGALVLGTASGPVGPPAMTCSLT